MGIHIPLTGDIAETHRDRYTELGIQSKSDRLFLSRGAAFYLSHFHSDNWQSNVSWSNISLWVTVQTGSCSYGYSQWTAARLTRAGFLSVTAVRVHLVWPATFISWEKNSAPPPSPISSPRWWAPMARLKHLFHLGSHLLRDSRTCRCNSITVYTVIIKTGITSDFQPSYISSPAV